MGWFSDWFWQGVPSTRMFADEEVRRVRAEIAARPDSGFESSNTVLADRTDIRSRYGERDGLRLIELAQQPLHGCHYPEIADLPAGGA
jgi:hypothetical protein